MAKDGIARIIDFGLAKSSEVTATLDGSARGTPLYMSPEQASEKLSISAPTYGAWAWSCMRCWRGEPPFRGETQLQVMRAIVHDDPPRLRERGPIFPLKSRPSFRGRSKRIRQSDISPRQRWLTIVRALAALEAPTAARWLASCIRNSGRHPDRAGRRLALWFYQRSEKRHLGARTGDPGNRQVDSQKSLGGVPSSAESARVYTRRSPTGADRGETRHIPPSVRRRQGLPWKSRIICRPATHGIRSARPR